MAITAKEVNALRQATGAGMMDCKKALTEAGGDFDKAIEILRKKGEKVSAKRETSNEGAVFAKRSDDGKEAVMIEINCETDFVSRNEGFQELGNSIIDSVFNGKPSDMNALMQLSVDGLTIEQKLLEAMGKIGEKMEIKKYGHINADRVVTYIHPGARVGVAVGFEGVGDEDIDAIGRDVAMQIAAMRPIAIDGDGVPQDVKEKEMEIGREIAIKEGKPENIVERIAEGKLRKFLKESTLLEQDFVKDSSKTVAQFLKEKNPNLKVKAFKRMELGSN